MSFALHFHIDKDSMSTQEIYGLQDNRCMREAKGVLLSLKSQPVGPQSKVIRLSSLRNSNEKILILVLILFVTVL